MRKENILVVDVRRNRSRNLLTTYLSNLSGFDLEEACHLSKLNSMDLSNFFAIIHQGGDGSLGYLLNLLYRYREKEKENSRREIPPVIYLGGGTAGTTFKGLINHPNYQPIPEDLKKLIPEGLVINYYPLNITLENEEDEMTAAYLAGFGHLTIGVTQLFEELRRNINNPNFAYVLAGIFSLFNLNQGVKSGGVVIQKNGENFGLNNGYLGSLEVLTIPYLATFSLNQPYPDNNQVYLLSIEGKTPEELFLRYTTTLMIGALFSGGPNWLINQGVVNLRQIDEISVLPDQRKKENACIDGELRHFSGRIFVSRKKIPIPIIIPRI